MSLEIDQNEFEIKLHGGRLIIPIMLLGHLVVELHITKYISGGKVSFLTTSSCCHADATWHHAYVLYIMDLIHPSAEKSSVWRNPFDPPLDQVPGNELKLFQGRVLEINQAKSPNKTGTLSSPQHFQTQPDISQLFTNTACTAVCTDLLSRNESKWDKLNISKCRSYRTWHQLKREAN